MSKVQVTKIFATLTSLFGHKFTSLFKTPEEVLFSQGLWAKYCGFLTEYEIETALDRCMKMSDWNPSMAEFIRMALSLPDVNTAVSRVISGGTIDHVSRAIRKNIGTWDIGHQPQSVIAARVRGEYPDVYMQAVEDRQ